MFDNNFGLFMNVWPWIGLGMAVVILVLMFCTDWLRMNLKVSRWLDPAWLAWLGSVQYMVHNIEEYGIDITGTTLPFPKMMVDVLNVHMPESFFLSVNLPMIWFCGPLMAVLTRKHPYCAMAMASFAFINVFSHVVPAFAVGYNSGMLTALVIFLPVFLWTAYVCISKLKWSWGLLGWSIVGGILYHVVLFAVIFASRAGLIGPFGQSFTLILVGILFVCFSLWYAKRMERKAA
jgi:hypothetical protein